MISAQHTPGPWYATIALDSNGGHAVRHAGSVVAVAERHTPPCVDDIEGCANAHLIAAAPDLLLACTTLIGAPTGDPWAIERARAAIAKATGAA